jgi:3-phosphoglycerate kinase
LSFTGRYDIMESEISANKMKLLSALPASEIAGKRVLLRADFNVPIQDGEVQG